MDAKIFNNLKTTYPVGTKVRLVRMDDPHPVPKGTLGTVIGVDDIGSLLVKWENGSCLNVLYGIDIVEKVMCDVGNYDSNGWRQTLRL
ncbi:TPA: DUF4314 domain-containing protein [Streptococcus suis]|nr:DUF4314 domain-containing protein [Streptococcus gallolyticus]MCF1635307.1 DUF4314 domain-containing protein [Streptococcus gallolyticus]HEM3635472.1 DUF4314 domain-containing protein [Streptococcus suis]